jgi:hypothetical protein
MAYLRQKKESQVGKWPWKWGFGLVLALAGVNLWL